MFYHSVAYTTLLVFIFFVFPGLLYLNSVLLLGDVFLANASELIKLVPDMKFSDFCALCMEGQQPDSKVLPLGGHVIVAGIKDGKEYVCVDVAEALYRCKPNSAVSATAGKVLKSFLRISKVVCAGLSDFEKPASNQSKK
jgi:hypothetical protein